MRLNFVEIWNSMVLLAILAWFVVVKFDPPQPHRWLPFFGPPENFPVSRETDLTYWLQKEKIANIFLWFILSTDVYSRRGMVHFGLSLVKLIVTVIEFNQHFFARKHFCAFINSWSFQVHFLNCRWSRFWLCSKDISKIYLDIDFYSYVYLFRRSRRMSLLLVFQWGSTF